MKIVFLDVDGVINTHSTEGKFEDSCVEALKHIITETGAEIVLSSTWRYKQSSMDQVEDKLKSSGIWQPKKTFLGATCHLQKIEGVPSYPIENSHATRTDEILLWIKCNGISSNTTRSDFGDDSEERFYRPFPDVIHSNKELWDKGEEWGCTGNWILDEPVVIDQFVVLDDLKMLQEGCYGKFLKGHFTHTNAMVGLTMEQAKETVRQLNSPFHLKKWRKNVFKPCYNPECLSPDPDAPERKQTSCLVS